MKIFAGPIQTDPCLNRPDIYFNFNSQYKKSSKIFDFLG